jgi:hypothetical protein
MMGVEVDFQLPSWNPTHLRSVNNTTRKQNTVYVFQSAEQSKRKQSTRQVTKIYNTVKSVTQSGHPGDPKLVAV